MRFTLNCEDLSITWNNLISENRLRGIQDQSFKRNKYLSYLIAFFIIV